MRRKWNSFFNEFERWLFANYTDVLLPHQRSSTVGQEWDAKRLPTGVVKRVKRVRNDAKDLLKSVWKGIPNDELLERCGFTREDLEGELGHYRKLICLLAERIEALDDYYRKKKNASALVAAMKLHDFVEQKLKELEEMQLFDEEESEKVAKVEVEPSPKGPEEKKVPLRAVGRIAPTSRHPAGVGRFPFWAESDADLALGELIVAEGKGPDGREVQIFAAIEDLRRESSYETPMQHYAAHDLGNASAEPATEPLMPLVGEAAVIHRSDGRSAPPGGAWPIRPARAREAEEAINKDVEERWAVPAGVVPLRGGSAVANYDLRFIAGPEGGHVNVSGISGVAAKTSYAVFLLTGLMAFAHREQRGGGLAAVLFNVKEEDLMGLHVDSETWHKALARAEEDPFGTLGFSARVYRELARKVRGFDPGRLFRRVKDPLGSSEPGVVYLAPQAPEQDTPTPFTVVEKERWDEVLPFQFTVEDLGDRLLSAFDPEDLDEKLETTLRYILAQGHRTLGELEGAVQQELSRTEDQGSGKRRTRASEAGHQLTLQKLRHRLRGVSADLRGLVAKERITTDRPELERLLQPGRVLVFDVTQLTERARRVLIGWLIGEIERLLVERKTRSGGLDTPDEESRLPSRVVVFADELNRFAPKLGRSEVGRIFGRVAAQGRSYGLAIVGMQQQASRVNEQILTNSSTLVVGRSHAAELGRGDAYGWMSRGLKEQAADLDKGQVIASHPAWRQPLILRFPLPHHQLVKFALEGSGDGRD